MALNPGTRLGAYEIVSQIGVGGMGEVYRATDTKLKRDVAIKVLPAAVAADSERLARFQREAEVLASLNHPNIAHIHGIEESDGAKALVMELVEGPTLADRIAQGPIPVDEALPIAKQIAEALEAAHERGIVHRDLKPANIKVRPDGTVKVLDFGLAKAMESGGPEGPPYGTSASMSPTITTPAMTAAGIILGTAAYMSPEQAKGKPVDKRTDIWAFGCVLYEMLTGRRAFDGEDVADVLSRVLQRDPDLAALPGGTPKHVRLLIARCLVKDPRQRLRDVGDARLALDGAFDVADTTVETHQPMGWKRLVPVALGAFVVGGVAVGLALGGSRPSPSPASETRFSVESPRVDVRREYSRVVALSPDGQTLAYIATNGGTRQVYRRPLAQLTAEPIPGTEGANAVFFSPDGEWMGFAIGSELKKVSLTGSLPTTVARSAATGKPITAASWGTNGVIVFSTYGTGSVLQAVSASGGEPEMITTLDAAYGDTYHASPEVLPGGRAVIFESQQGIFVQSIDTGGRRLLIPNAETPRLVPSGHLVFERDGALFVIRFDGERLLTVGEAVPFVKEGAAPVLSANGTLAYVGGASVDRTLVWVDRTGHETDAGVAERPYLHLKLSPDGTQVAASVQDPLNGSDILIEDFSRPVSTPVVEEPAQATQPLFTPDGERLLFASNRDGVRNIYWRAANGVGAVERLFDSPYPVGPDTWTKDGRRLVYHELHSETSWDLMTLSLDTRQTQPLVSDPGAQLGPALSPDEKWLAYSEGGESGISVRPFPAVSSNRWRVSTGGSEPKWAANGRELFYAQSDGVSVAVMMVPYVTTPAFAPGTPVELFRGAYSFEAGAKNWDVAPDGRFLFMKPATANLSVIVHQNWTEELKRLLPPQ